MCSLPGTGLEGPSVWDSQQREHVTPWQINDAYSLQLASLHYNKHTQSKYTNQMMSIIMHISLWTRDHK